MQMLRLKEIQSKTGLRKSSIYLRIKEGVLPRPIKLGRASLWVESEVDFALQKIVEAARASDRAKPQSQ